MQEYRSRREELEKQRGRQAVNISLCQLSPSQTEESCSPILSPVATPTSVSKPAMHSVQVQTQDAPLAEETEKRYVHTSTNYELE